MRRMYWAAAALVLAAAGSAQAGFTHITNGGTSGASTEATVPAGRNANIANILGAVYGGANNLGTATLFDGTRLDSSSSMVDFEIRNSGGTLVAIARRLADTFGGVGSVFTVGSSNWNTAGVTDQVWRDSTVAFRGEAKFAGDRQHLWTVGGDGTGADGTTDHKLFINDNGFQPSVTYYGANPGLVPSSPFRWLRSSDISSGAPSDHLDYSRESNNGTGSDQMVSYQIFNADGTTNFGGYRTFMMFFEDRFANEGSDRDFNDLAYQLQVVPLPPAAWAGISSLAGVAGFGIIRRRRLRAS